RRRHTRWPRDWSSDVCSSDLTIHNMSRKTGKKYTAAFNQVERKPYSIDQAVPLVQKIKFAKFDETVELHLRLGVDPKHADQMVRSEERRVGKERRCWRETAAK